MGTIDSAEGSFFLCLNHFPSFNTVALANESKVNNES